jgi:hypothetical protein
MRAHMRGTMVSVTEIFAPPENPLCSIVGTQTNLRTMRARNIRRCTSARSAQSSSALSPSEAHASEDSSRAELLLQVMQVLSKELELRVMSIPSPGSEIVPDICINHMNGMQSSLLSASFLASKSSDRHGWNQLSSAVPLLLDFKTRMSLFRKASGTSTEDLENMKKDRVNGVERSRILEWAAAIAAAQLRQGRRNPLTVQVKIDCSLSAFCHLLLCVICLESERWLFQFSMDGVIEPGFGEAVTNSFFCDVADAFSRGKAGSSVVCLRFALLHDFGSFFRSCFQLSLQRKLECGSSTTKI